MPRGAPPGTRYGGRQKGTPNKITQDVAKTLDELGCNPLELSAKIALGEELDGPHPSLKTFIAFMDRLDKWLEAEDIMKAKHIAEGLRSTIEQELTQGYVPIELRSKHIVDLTQYILPKRKAVDVTTGGNPIEQLISVYIPDNGRK